MKTVQMCADWPPMGECGGECFACRLYALQKKHEALENKLFWLRQAVCRLSEAMKVMRNIQEECFQVWSQEWFNQAINQAKRAGLETVASELERLLAENRS